jgi:hypothetical protein
VNFSEPGTAELCTHLLSCNVGIEAGIWTVEDAHLLLKLGLADRCLRVLIELQEQEDGGDFYAAAWEGLCEKEQQLLVVTWTTSRPSSRGIEAVGLPVSETSIRYTT